MVNMLRLEEKTHRVTGKRRNWPWVLLLAIVVISFISYSLPPYLSLDPARSRVSVPAYFPEYYPLLVAHVLFASVAMATSCLQVWPWFRRCHPAAHLFVGRVYVFGGVFPAGLTGLVIGAFSPFGPMTRVSNVLLAVLWLGCTIAGFRAARQCRFGDHRRWMIRSFALTMSIITNRLWIVVSIIVLKPQLETTFGGSELAAKQAISGLSSWLGLVTALLLAQWWLERKTSVRP